MSRIRNRRWGFSRRQLLKSLGVSAAVSPFIPLLNASGQENLFPKRLLLFYCPDGTASIDHGGAMVEWEPQGTETSFTLQATHEPLTEFQSKIVVPYGLKMSAGGAGQEHAFGMAGLWSGATLHGPSGDADFDGGNGNRTGWGSGPSVDQIIALNYGTNMPYERAADDAQPETPYRTLELGAQCNEPDSKHRMIYKGDNQPLHPETNPKAAYDRLFGNLMLDNTGTTDQGPDYAAIQQQASVDLLLGELDRLRTRVGSEDYAKIDAHAEGLRAIERRITTTTSVPSEGCSLPAEPAAETSQYENSAQFPDDVSAMIDLAVHALACDLTRVASVQLSRGFSLIQHQWLGQNQGHHTISHLDGDNRDQLLAIDQWYAERFADLLRGLDSIQEGDGTLLDNTLVVWGREMGQTNHRMQPWPGIFAGGARGGLVTGRYLKYNNEPHAKALVSIAQLMGLDTNSVGDIDANSGPLDGLV